MKPKKIVLDAYEQSIEDSIERGEWKPVSEAKKAELMAKLRLAHESLRKGRGGARPNAGRKTLGHVHLGINIKPETRAILLAEAGGKARGMGAVLDRWAAKAKRRKTAAT